MRKWEDIVKDKMEEPEGALPESVFAEFRARREATTTSAKKRFPLGWTVVPAVAAGLAAVLLLRGPAEPEGDIQIIQQPLAPVAVVTDSTTVDEPELATPLIAQTVTPKVRRPSVVKSQKVDIVDRIEPAEEVITTPVEEETLEPEARGSVTEDTKDTPLSSPFIPESTPTSPAKIKVGSAAGIVAGGGLLAAALSPLLGAWQMTDISPRPIDDPGLYTAEPDRPDEERMTHVSHYFPLKLGLSTRIPVGERFSFTTGLEYTRYKSTFTYTLSGEKIQQAHYLGVPVRLDWTLAANRWLEVYLGGGIEGDYCLGATLAGAPIRRDGFSASLLGAGGIQCKLTPRLGLYVEPEVSWTFTPGHPVLVTYRTDHPLMVSVGAGLRYTFPIR